MSLENQSTSDEPVGFTAMGVVQMAGGCGAVAAKLGLTVQTVSKWDRRIPGPHARQVAIMAGLPLAVVRPDMVKPEGQ